ncbi:MAG: M14 family zinc carboxypeptidase [Candidatus Krumholzibacteriia bacterium]
MSRCRTCALGLAVILGAALPTGGGAAVPPAPPHHDLVVVAAPGGTLAALAAAGYDIVGGKPGLEAKLLATPAEQARLAADGHRFVVAQRDLEGFYAARNGKGTGFGAFHTYSETMGRLDELHAAYPAITTAKYSLGTTSEGRTVWALKVSDNPDLDEGEPAVLFDGLHHAREPMSTEACLMLIDYLGSRYATDPDVRRLVDGREIYFVPIVNPDGYVYNELTNPAGGGLWRKNRRDNGDGTYGVDPYRNYPYAWVGPGSSTDPASEIYRGPYAGSEPEVQAVMNLALAHRFQTAQDFHTYSNFVLLPWGWTPDPTPDDAIFRDVANTLAATNGYTVGQPPEILYVVNGGGIDWQYGEQTAKGKTFAFSNEIGGESDGFWPPDARIPQLFQDNLPGALYLIEVAGPSLFVRNLAVTGGDGNGRLDPGESAGLALDALNGAVMMIAADVSVTLLSDDAYLQLGEAQRTLGTLGPRGVWSGAASPFPVSVDAACPVGHVIPLVLRFAWTGGAKEVAVGLPVGAPAVLVSDNLESGTLPWRLAPPWGLTTTASHSPTHSLTDSPSGLYANNVNASAQLRSTLDLSVVSSPALTFWTRYDTELGYDFCYVEVSTDGITWQTIATYGGTQTAWVQKTLPLDAWLGQAQLRLRFRFQSDGSVTADGWYLDDVTVTGYPAAADTAPTAPTALAPVGGATVTNLAFTVLNAVDPDGPAPLTYGFRIYGDPYFTLPVMTHTGQPEGSGQTVWTVPDGTLAGGTWYWRAWADDSALRGPLSPGEAFVFDTQTGVADGARPAWLAATRSGGGTTFRFAVPRAGRATLTLYNLRGERVAVVFAGDVATETAVVWNQRDDAGAPVASGLYLARLSAPGATLSLKLLVVR